MRIGLLIVVVFCLMEGYRPAGADEFRIPLNSESFANKSLMWFPKSVRESPELKASDNGVIVEQNSSDGGPGTGSIGFKLNIPTSGDFQYEVDLEEIKVQAPQSGWGQGFLLKVKMADRWQTVLTMGVAARPKSGAQMMVTYESVPNTNPIYAWIPMNFDFTSGRICIRREKDKAIFSVKPKATSSTGGEIILKEMPVPVADVATFEFVCTRLKEGNTNARVELKEVYLKGEAHDGLRTSPQGLSFVMLYLGPPLLIMFAAVLAVVMIKRKTVSDNVNEGDQG